MKDYRLSLEALCELRMKHQQCKERKAADRIKAVYLLGKGWRVAEVSEALLIEDDAIRSYINLYKAGKIKALMLNPYQGRSCELTEKELSLLASHLRVYTYCTVSEIIDYVNEEFEVSYSESGMRKILKRLDFVYKKPEKIPFRVDADAQNNFIQRYKRLKKKLAKGDGLYFMDATHPEHTAVPGHGWIKRGETKVVRSNSRPYRLNINGAINMKTLEMVVRFEQVINKETTLDFLEALRRHQSKGWIYLICDNAGYYTAPEVQAYAKGLAIKLVYLRPYSPNLNLIERIWKFFKKKILYNRHYEEFLDMIKASKKFFREISQYHNELKTLMTEKFQMLNV